MFDEKQILVEAVILGIVVVLVFFLLLCLVTIL